MQYSSLLCLTHLGKNSELNTRKGSNTTLLQCDSLSNLKQTVQSLSETRKIYVKPKSQSWKVLIRSLCSVVENDRELCWFLTAMFNLLSRLSEVISDNAIQAHFVIFRLRLSQIYVGCSKSLLPKLGLVCIVFAISVILSGLPARLFILIFLSCFGVWFTRRIYLKTSMSKRYFNRTSRWAS